MAHTCPSCGSLCHCGGDIDDIDFGIKWFCCHCDDEDDDEDYDEFDCDTDDENDKE